MYMRDWIVKLDDFLRLSGREQLDHAGHISHDEALAKARLEYEKYRQLTDQQLSQVEEHFFQAVKALKPLPKQAKPRRRKT